MAIGKLTEIDQIEVTRSGVIQVRLALLLMEDGAEIDRKWHRTVIEPGTDVDTQIALVNDHLDQMGKARLGDGDQMEQLRQVAAILHTPERVAAYRETMLAAQAALAANP